MEALVLPRTLPGAKAFLRLNLTPQHPGQDLVDGMTQLIAGPGALRAVQAVGNYGEVFERNIGSHSPLALPRGLNQLWSNGGILYAPPLQ